MRAYRVSYLSAFIGALLLVAGTATAQIVVDVTFDVTLPADTPLTDTIYVAGNFQGWDPGATPLTRDSPTHAYGTITTTEGNALAFKFTRGGWDRVEKASDCSDISDRMATATPNLTIYATVANWADRCVPVYDSRAQKVQINSAALGVPKEFYVYTPPGYTATSGRRYPTLYLFRGHEKEWINKNEDPSRGGTNVIDVYEELLADGEVGPMILVFPGISSNDNSVSGMLTNFIAPHLTGAAGIGTGKFKDYFINEIIGYVDGNYRTVARKDGRGVDGFSLGGFMSVKIAAQHPELFKTVGAFDGTHFYADLECDNIAAYDTTYTNDMFDPVFGEPRDTAFSALNNGPTLVCLSSADAMKSMRWFIQYGPASSEPNNANFIRGDHLVQKMTAKGVANEITAVLDGGHNWATADEHMRQTLPLHWAVLGLSTLEVDSINILADRVRLRGFGLPFEMHTIEATENLSGNFMPIGSVAAEEDGDLVFEDIGGEDYTNRFYRIKYP